MSDVIERIDAVTADETCPHCNRQWHDRPLTGRVAQMYDQKLLDPSYFAGADHSPVVCEGSYLIGPRRPKPEIVSLSLGMSDWTFVGHMEVTVQLFTAAMESLTEKLTWPEFNLAPWFQSQIITWLTPSKPETCPATELDVAIQFGTQNWLRTEPIGHVPAELPYNVSAHWHVMTTTNIPTPTSPGYDFSKYNTQPTHYPTHKEWK